MHPHINPMLLPAIESKVNINKLITITSALIKFIIGTNYDESLSLTIQYVINC